MGKRKMINAIKKAFVEHGKESFTMNELQAESSPCIQIIDDNTCQLIETLYLDNVEAVVYVKDIQQSQSFIGYGKLSDDILAEILQLIENYERY